MLCGAGFCSIPFLKVDKMFDATVQNFLLKTLKTTAHTFFFWSLYACATFFWSPLLLRFSATLGFSLKVTISIIVSSILGDLTS